MSKANPAKLSDEIIGEITTVFRMLGDNTRCKLVYQLCHRELSVSDLCSEVDVSPSAVSHQLAKLKANRIVQSRRVGNRILYSIDDSHIARLFREVIFHLEHVRENLPDNPYPGNLGKF
jgi:ArsR family transcriptional regulator